MSKNKLTVESVLDTFYVDIKNEWINDINSDKPGWYDENKGMILTKRHQIFNMSFMSSEKWNKLRRITEEKWKRDDNSSFQIKLGGGIFSEIMENGQTIIWQPTVFDASWVASSDTQL